MTRIVNSEDFITGQCAEHCMPKFDGDLVIPFHFLRQALKYSLILWHDTEVSERVVEFLRKETTAYLDVYSSSHDLKGLRDDFEMHLAMAVALSGMHDRAEFLYRSFDYTPCEDYTYYVGFRQAMLALMLGDDSLASQARESLAGCNATKFFYFPSKTVILAALDGDLKKLRSSVRPIARKFDGYAAKMHAVEGDAIDVTRLDSSWFSPYPDWAFYAQAIRRFGPVDGKDTFWMPMRFLNHFAEER